VISAGDVLERALEAFDAESFAERHGGHKESRSPRSFEYLLICTCGSDRLRWRHQPGVKQAWICWGCSTTGDTLDLVGRLEGLDRNGAAAYVEAGYVGGDAPTGLVAGARVRAPARTSLMRLPQMPYPHGVEALTWGAPRHLKAWRYLLEERGLARETVSSWPLGIGVEGWLRDYVVFPVQMDGGLVYWQGRASWDPPKHLDKDGRKAWAKATGYRKTLNPANRDKQASAEEVLFNYDRARVSTHVVVVEGPIDALQVGPHCVALFGKRASDTKVERLLRMLAHRYTIYLDPGAEEHAKARQLARQLHEFAPTFIASPPPGADPGELTPEQNARIIEKAPAYRTQGLTSRLRIV